MSKFDTLKATVAGTPGASWRPDELLVRFGDGGSGTTTVAGAHVTALVRTPDVDGTTSSRVYGPFPVGVLAGDATLKGILGDTRIAQQATIDKLATEAQAAATAIKKGAVDLAASTEALNTTTADLEAERRKTAALDAAIQKHLDVVARQSSDLATAAADRAAAAARIDDLASQVALLTAQVNALGGPELAAQKAKDAARAAALKAIEEASAQLAELDADPEANAPPTEAAP